MSPTTKQTVRVLAVADSDSYLKWSLATLRRMPSEWRTSQVVIDSPLRPTSAQVQISAPVLSRAGVLRRIRDERPDVVLLGCTGPVVAALIGACELREPGRPVLLTGLPGISYPVRPRAITLRTGCDLMLLHSHREVAAFTIAATNLGSPLRFALATLPFLAALAERSGAGDHAVRRPGRDPGRPGPTARRSCSPSPTVPGRWSNFARPAASNRPTARPGATRDWRPTSVSKGRGQHRVPDRPAARRAWAGGGPGHGVVDGGARGDRGRRADLDPHRLRGGRRRRSTPCSTAPAVWARWPICGPVGSPGPARVADPELLPPRRRRRLAAATRCPDQPAARRWPAGPGPDPFLAGCGPFAAGSGCWHQRRSWLAGGSRGRRVRCQHQVAQLADGTVTAGPVEHPPGGRPDLRLGVGDRDRPADQAHRPEIVEVVAEIGRPGRRRCRGSAASRAPPRPCARSRAAPRPRASPPGPARPGWSPSTRSAAARRRGAAARPRGRRCD